MLAGEALPAVVAFVDGVLTPGAARWQRWWWGQRWFGASPVGLLPAGGAAEALVGAAGQRCVADRAAGSRYGGVTRRAVRH